MRSKKSVETIKLKDGQYLEKEFDNYIDMAKNAVDWTLFCSYQLQPNFSEGIYKIVQLPSMQIAHTSMIGGIMFDFVIPEDCITFSVMRNISQKASIDQMKLHTDMISIMDDSKIYNFVCRGEVELIDLSLNKDKNPILIEKLNNSIDRYYIDDDGAIGSMLMDIIDRFSNINILEESISIELEDQIVQAITKLVDRQEVKIPYFTKSEKIVMGIKKDLFSHMDHTRSIGLFAKKYNISTKSLQNGFKSLFDIKPNQFMRLLKLNLVHHELNQSSSSDTTVQRVARKWGFAHMGRFSMYYSELFGENPSITLKKSTPKVDGMRSHCIDRREEIL